MAGIKIADGIISLSDFKSRAAEHLRHIDDTGEPVVITQNGKAAAVLLSPREYDALTERARFVAAIVEGIEDAEAGRTVGHRSLVAEMSARYEVPTGDTRR